MASFPPRFYLRKDERVLIDRGITPSWAFEQAFAWLIVGLVLFGGLSIPVMLGDFPGRDDALLGLAVGFVVFWSLMLVYTWRRIVTTEYIVTEEAVYTRRGKFLVAVGAATLDRVTDLHVHTGLFGRLFQYSRLVIKTAGGELSMLGLRDAYDLRGVIHDTRQRLLTRLLREAGRTPEATTTKAPNASLEIECPQCENAFSVVGTPPLDVRCPKCQATGTLFAEALA